MTLVAALLAAPVLALIHAVVVRTLWSWFAVPLGAPDIGYAHAYGLALLISLLTYQPDSADGGNSALTVTIAALVRSAVTLAFAWVAFQLTGF